jgi:hypothetical protein
MERPRAEVKWRGVAPMRPPRDRRMLARAPGRSAVRRALIIAALVLAGPAEAHHSLAGYDHARQRELEGVVAAFHYTQPHPFLVVAAADGDWRLEMDNLFELDSVGVTRETFRPGDRVSVSGAPARNGAHALYLRRLDRPRDGLRYEQVGSSPRLTPGSR